MKKNFITTLVSCAFIASCVAQPVLPCYEIRLKSEEYPIFSQAVYSSLFEKGGKLNYSNEVIKEQSGLFVHLKFCNKGDVDLIKSQLSKRVMNIVQSANINNLNNQSKWEINVLKSLDERLNYALKYPARELVNRIGVLTQDDRVIRLLSTNEKLILFSDDPNTFKDLLGQEVEVRGYYRTDESFKIESIKAYAHDHIEVFIMSKCPFGTQAIQNIMTHFKDSQEILRRVDVRYIFYKSPSGFTSLHGEDELLENLIQMQIRDQFPNYFWIYLKERLSEKEKNWQEIAEKIQIPKNGIKLIEERVNSLERKKLISTEYSYVSQFRGIKDGSPTYFWKGERIYYLGQVPIFKGIEQNSELLDSCSE